MKSQFSLEVHKRKGAVSITWVLLTYPKCDVDREVLSNFLSVNLNSDSHVVCQEHHKDQSLHLHALVHISSITTTIRKFMSSLVFNNHTADCRLLKGIDNIRRAYSYVTKEDNSALHVNFDKEKYLSNNKSKRRNAKELLTSDPVQLVDNDTISAFSYTNLVRAQAHYALVSAPIKNFNHVRGIWLHGKPGTGKSFYARSFGDRLGGSFIKAQNKWWDGYKNQPVVIIDDLDSSCLNHYLKIWADSYHTAGELKGSYAPLQYEWLIVTSNYTVEEIIMSDSRREIMDTELLAALTRRFFIFEFTDFNSYKHVESWFGNFLAQTHEVPVLKLQPIEDLITQANDTTSLPVLPMEPELPKESTLPLLDDSGELHQSGYTF